MEKISTNPDLNNTNAPINSSSSTNQQSVSVPAVTGELEGSKLISVEPASQKNFASSSLSSTASLSRGDSLQSFTQVQNKSASSSSSSSSTPVIDSHLSWSGEEDQDLARIDNKRSWLEQKIENAKKVLQEGNISPKLNEPQIKYIEHLQKALALTNMDEVFSLVDESTGHSIVPEITLAIEQIVEMAETIKKQAGIHEFATPQAQQVHGVMLQAIQNAIDCYVNYAEAVKDMQRPKATADFCLVKKYFSTFKALEASQKANWILSEYYEQAAQCYQTATKRMENDVDRSSPSLERAGDMFMRAAQAIESKQSSELISCYATAGECFQEKSQYEFLMSTKATMSNDPLMKKYESLVIYLGNAVDQFLKSSDAMQQGQSKLADYFFAAGSCFQEAADELKEEPSSMQKRKNWLTAKDHYLRAAEELQANRTALANLQHLLGLSMQGKVATAMTDDDEKVKVLYGDFYKIFSVMLDKIQARTEQKPDDLDLVIETYFKIATDALLRSRPQIAEISQNMAVSLYLEKESRLSQNKDVIEILKNSSKKILPQLKESNKKLSPDIKRWICLNDSYWNLEQERKKGTDEQDPVAGLFQSTIKYTKIAVTEGEKKSSSKKEISFVDLSAFSLYTAAKKLQQGKKELSDAYEKYAASCFLLAAIQQLAEGKKADLLNQLPVALRFSFKEGSVPKPTVLHYWEKVVDDNWKNIELLEAKHVGQI